jgi:hypothetical protein
MVRVCMAGREVLANLHTSVGTNPANTWTRDGVQVEGIVQRAHCIRFTCTSTDRPRPSGASEGGEAGAAGLAQARQSQGIRAVSVERMPD